MTNSIFSILGGLSVFVYGMTLMSEGLHQAAGERLRTILSFFSRNRIVAVIAGAVVTCIIQSSSASTVMIIGNVDDRTNTLCMRKGLKLRLRKADNACFKSPNALDGPYGAFYGASY